MIKKKLPASSFQLPKNISGFLHSLKAESWQLAAAAQASRRGFTLIETLVAILLISVAILAPMELTIQSLNAAYYARDQITASYLAQEGLEIIRNVRDDSILSIAEGSNTTDILNTVLYVCTSSCSVDGTETGPTSVSSCGGPCPTLIVNASKGLYAEPITGGSPLAGWTPSDFTRTITVTPIRKDPVTGSTEEIRVTSKVAWKTSNFQTESVTLSEDLYNWVTPGAAA